jgi:hypothetical protein
MTDSNTLEDYDIKDFDKLLGYVPGNHKVGQLGSISLDVCASCIRKFDENDGIFGNIDLQQKIARNEEDAGGD